MSGPYHEILQQALARAASYLEALPDRRVFPTPEHIEQLETFAQPLPYSGTDPLEVLRQLDELGSAGTVASMGGRYFGFVTGGVVPAALGAKILGTVWDQNNAARAGSPIAAKLEEVVLGWLVELFGLPEGTGGALVTGASMANFSALAAARHALLRRAGWNVEEDGLFGAPEVKVVVSEESHSTVFKALQMVGFGRSRVHKVPTDAQGRMQAELLPALDDRTLICVQAGNVNSGAFDPIEAVMDRAKASGAWVHVDGAFGMWAAASPQLAHFTQGIARADSWATDGHKWLNTPYDCGIVLVRDPKTLRSAFVLSNAPYLQMHASSEREPLEYTPEASRRARSLEVWAAIKSLGQEGIAQMIERNCAQARQFAEGFRSAGLEVPHEVVINQVLVSFGDDQRTKRVIAAIQHEGTLWAGSTVWKGRTFMRLSCSSWRTTAEDVERSLGAILRVNAEIV